MMELGAIAAASFIPPRSPTFLAVLAIHIPAGLTCVVAGAGAALSPKRHGRHPRFGTVYYWALAVVLVTTIGLTIMRPQDAYLLALGTFAFAAATTGRIARRRRWPRWVPVHIAGMGSSYILLLVAFYVDNGKNLPVWRDLPHVAYWAIPTLIGVPLVARALSRYTDLYSAHHQERR